MSFWLSDNGRFPIPSNQELGHLLVMGEDITVTPQDSTSQGFSYAGTSGVQQSTSTSVSGRTPSSLFGNSSVPFSRRSSALVKTVHTEHLGKGQFSEMGQTYIHLNKETANVKFVLMKTKEAFCDDQLELVTSNSLPLKDNEGTRGNKYYIQMPTSSFLSLNTHRSMFS